MSAADGRQTGDLDWRRFTACGGLQLPNHASAKVAGKRERGTLGTAGYSSSDYGSVGAWGVFCSSDDGPWLAEFNVHLFLIPPSIVPSCSSLPTNSSASNTICFPHPYDPSVLPLHGEAQVTGNSNNYATQANSNNLCFLNAGTRLDAPASNLQEPCTPCSGSQSPPGAVPSSLGASRGPFSGNYTGGIWNAQGLFHAVPRKRQRRKEYLSRMLAGRDFWIVSETHGGRGESEAFNTWLGQRGYTGYWSQFDRRRAGIGITVKNSFLAKFELASPTWTPLVTGEVGKLHLSGNSGDLDIFSVYMPTGNQAGDRGDLAGLRGGIRGVLANNIVGQMMALSTIGGDFNFVTSNEDRYTKATMSWSGHKDAAEQKDWEDRLEKPHGLHELHQPMATHNSGVARSRLDRLYTNHHVAEQLDSRFGCSCLDWCPQHSHHRPVVFFQTEVSHS